MTETFSMTELTESLQGPSSEVKRREVIAMLNDMLGKIEKSIGQGARPQEFEGHQKIFRAVRCASHLLQIQDS